MSDALELPDISISCVLYFTPLGDLKRCLDSVLVAAEQFGGRVDFYLVDNSTNDEYHSLLCSTLSQYSSVGVSVVVIRQANNDGYGAGNNRVLKTLGSRFHLIINPDVVVESDAFVIASEFLSENPSVGMLTPSVREPNGRIAHVVKGYPDGFTFLVRFLGLPWLNGLFVSRLSRYTCAHYNGILDPVLNIELAGGCFFFVRTSLFKRLNGFDPRYFLYFEDFDFCLRLRQYADIAFVPQVKIFHGGGDVGRKHWRHHVMFARSAWRFFTRNRFKVI